MRKFLVLFVLFLGVVFVIFSFSELEQTIATLQQGNLWYILLAFLIQVGWFFLVGITYRSLYRLLGMSESILNLTKVAAAATFVNVVMPTAGVGGIAIFVNAAKKDGHATGKVTLAAALFVLFDYAAFLAVLALGWIVLIRRNDLNAGEITASLILLSIAFILGFTLYLGSRSAEAMGRFLARLARLANTILRPFLRRNYLREERAYEFAQEMANGLKSLPDRPRGLLKPLFLAFLNKGLQICILLCAFLAFQVPFSAGVCNRVSVHDRFSHAFRYWCGGRNITPGIEFPTRGLEPGGVAHYRLSRNDFLAAAGNWSLGLPSLTTGKY